jgi:hypothetical protein
MRMMGREDIRGRVRVKGCRPSCCIWVAPNKNILFSIPWAPLDRPGGMFRKASQSAKREKHPSTIGLPPNGVPGTVRASPGGHGVALVHRYRRPPV